MMTGASYVDYLIRALGHECDRALLAGRGRRITRRPGRESAVRYAGPLHLCLDGYLDAEPLDVKPVGS